MDSYSALGCNIRGGRNRTQGWYNAWDIPLAAQDQEFHWGGFLWWVRIQSSLKAKSFKASSSQYFSLVYFLHLQSNPVFRLIQLPSDWERNKVLFLSSQQSPVQLLLQVRGSRCPRILSTLGPLPFVYQSLPRNARPSPSLLVPERKGIETFDASKLSEINLLHLLASEGNKNLFAKTDHSHHVTCIQFDFITVTKAK